MSFIFIVGHQTSFKNLIIEYKEEDKNEFIIDDTL